MKGIDASVESSGKVTPRAQAETGAGHGGGHGPWRPRSFGMVVTVMAMVTTVIGMVAIVIGMDTAIGFGRNWHGRNWRGHGRYWHGRWWSYGRVRKVPASLSGQGFLLVVRPAKFD